MKPGDSLKLKVVFAGQPLAGQTVFAYNRTGEKVCIQQYEINGSGEFRIKLDRAGFWLVRLVKMDRCAEDFEEADWESYWSSISFTVC